MITKRAKNLQQKSNKTKKGISEQGPDFVSFFEGLKSLATNKNLSYEQILEVFKNTLLAFYKKKYGPNSNIDVEINNQTKTINVKVHFNVVEKVQSPDYEKSLEEAKKIDENAKIGKTITIYESFETINRIDANAINKIFKQKIKDLEFEMVYEEFKDKKGEILTAQYSFSKGKDVIVTFDKGEGILPKSEQMPKDKYGPGKYFKVVIKDIILNKNEKDSKPLILVSRTSSEFVKALFKQEVTEIQDHLVEIISIVREAGFRTKMIVKSSRYDVDPLGACVGPKGVRIQSIVRELHNEKIDIVVYSENPANMISQALNPAKVTEVHVDTEAKEALVVVPDYELNKAIGPNGKNVKLASLLVGYKINIKSEREFREAMSSPEIRKKLEALFRVGSEEQEEQGISEETPLEELPGLTKRVIGLLKAAGIDSIEKLIFKKREDLLSISGIDKNTADYVLKIVQENVEIQEEGEDL